MYAYLNPGLASQVELVFEKVPVITAYLAGQAGRVAQGVKNHYPLQATSAIAIHAGKEIDIHEGTAGGGRHATRGAQAINYASPREERFEKIGVVIASKFPETKTFLAPSTADHLLKRFACLFS